jgi:DNA-binding NtrC family response regulator
LAYRLFIVEPDGCPSNLYSGGLFTDRNKFLYERVTWQSFTSDQLLRSQADVLIVVAWGDLGLLSAFFQWLEKTSLALPIIVILFETADLSQSLEISNVADEILFFPVGEREFECRLARLLEKNQKRDAVERTLNQEAAFAQLVGKSPAFVEALKTARLVAGSQAPVLLLGESGTGKELFAQAIHHLGANSAGPFIPVECGAIPENLLENELFGHTRGAFTGAHADQKGLASMAEGGTLFLDEVDALSLTAQAKLLRFIQERTFRALGSDKFERSNVRIVAATNSELEHEVHERRFRLDLYYRLNVLNINLPPLRERRGDIELLTHHYVRQLIDSGASPRRTFSPTALRMLEQYHWPGNVRELFSLVQRAMVLCDGPQILPRHIGFKEMGPSDLPRSGKLRNALENFERDYVQKLLTKHQGNITRAANEAGKDRRAFGRLVKQYSLERKAVAR